MKRIVALIDQVLRNLDSTEVQERVKAEVHELTRGFPLYSKPLRYAV